MAHQTTSRTARNMLSSLGLISVLILAGCGSNSSGGDGQDGQTTTPSAETSTTTGTDEYVPASADGPAQNVPVPELPDAAREQTEEGAEATLKYWWESIEYLHLTGDSGPMSEASDAECVTCRDQEQNWTNAYADEHWIALDGDFGTDIRDFEIVRDPDRIRIEYIAEMPKVEVFSPEGELIQGGLTEASTADVETLMSFDTDRGHWTMLETRMLENE